MLSSPTSGLDTSFCSWWPTVRGLDGVAVRLMESYLKELTLDITAEADTDDLSVPAPKLSEEDTVSFWKRRLLSDVMKTVKSQIDRIDRCGGYSIGCANDEDGTVFTMTVSLIEAHNNDSGMVEQPATHDPSSTPKEPKTELPTPTVAHIVPKSEAPRKAADKVCDQDGFWIDSSDDENDFVQVAKLTPKGCKIILLKYKM